MILDALHRIADCRESLSREEARAVTAEILSGKCTDAQIAALLVALHMKGETVEEIVGFAEAIRAAATPLNLRRDSTVDVSGTGHEALVDTCGTGGSASATFNISTATAFVVAGAGVRVAKHGNRSISSRKGSADVMEALGVNIQLPPERLDAAIIFAPVGQLVVQALRAVEKGGVVVCGGIHMSDLPAFPYELLWSERTICSVANLTRRDGEEFLAVAPKVPVRTTVQPFPLTAANEALSRLREGRLQGAAVLVPVWG